MDSFDILLDRCSACSRPYRADGIGDLHDVRLDAGVGGGSGMMALDDIHDAFVQSVFACDFRSDFRMGSFDVMVHGLSDVMEQSSFEGERRVGSELFRDGFRDVGDFLRMGEDILSEARPKAEFSHQAQDFVREPCNPHLIDGFFSEFEDEFLGIGFVDCDDFLNPSRLDSLILDELLKRFLRDESPEEIEARYEDGIRSVIDDQGYSGFPLEGDDIPSFFPDELSFDVIIVKMEGCLGCLAHDLTGILLDGFYDDLPGYFPLFQAHFGFLLLDGRDDILLVELFGLLHDEIASFLFRESGDIGKLGPQLVADFRHVFTLPLEVFGLLRDFHTFLFKFVKLCIDLIFLLNDLLLDLLDLDAPLFDIGTLFIQTLLGLFESILLIVEILILLGLDLRFFLCKLLVYKNTRESPSYNEG